MLRWREEQRFVRDEVELDAEAVGDPCDKIERGIRSTTFDRRDMCPRDAYRVRKRLLSDIEHRPSVEAQARERDPEVGGHGTSEALATHRRLIRRAVQVSSVSGTKSAQVRVDRCFVPHSTRSGRMTVYGCGERVS